jgi:hypothetical protein
LQSYKVVEQVYLSVSLSFDPAPGLELAFFSSDRYFSFLCAAIEKEMMRERKKMREK